MNLQDQDTRSEARLVELMGQLEFDNQDSNNYEILSELMVLFRSFPDLTLRSYSEFPSPLIYLLIIDVPLEIVEAYCDICPDFDKVLEPSKSFMPIHIACQNSSEEVVQYFIRRTPPSLLKQKTRARGFAFNLALTNRRHRMSGATLQQLMEASPEAVAIPHAFTFAIRRNGSHQLLNRMVEIFPSTSTSLIVSGPMSLDQARIISKLFPRLERFSYAGSGEVNLVFPYFLKEIRENQSIKDLFLVPTPLLSEMAEEERKALLDAFQLTLNRNSVLERVEIKFQDDEPISFLWLWLQTITDGLAQNNSIERFWVDNWTSAPAFSFTSTKPMSTGVTKPSTVWLSREWYQRIRGSPQRMQELQYCPRSEHDDYTIQLCQQVVPRLPKLASLILTIPPNIDRKPSKPVLTNAVIGLLASAPHLERLKIKHLSLNLEEVWAALRNNRNLKSFYNQCCRQEALTSQDGENCLELLKEHNLTLIECTLDGLDDPRIQYYLDLNRLGREKVRSVTRVVDLIELLGHVEDDVVLDDRLESNELVEAAKQGMLYGLLREVPSLWSSGI